MYWVMHRINLGIYRRIYVNVITSSSMSDCSLSLPMFNLFFLKKVIPRKGNNFTFFSKLDCWIYYLSYSHLVINNQFISTHILQRLINEKAFSLIISDSFLYLLKSNSVIWELLLIFLTISSKISLSSIMLYSYDILGLHVS